MRLGNGNFFKIILSCIILVFFGCSLGYAWEFEYDALNDTTIIPQVNARGMSDAGKVVGFFKNGGFILENDMFDTYSIGSNTTYLMDISNNGNLIVGYYVDEDAANPEVGFIDNGTVVTVTYGGFGTILTGVNDIGHYVGVTIQDGEPLTLTQGLQSFWYDGTGRIDIAYPGTDGVVTQTLAMDINDAGIIVGSYQNVDGWHGFTYNPVGEVWATVNAHNMGPGYSTFVTGINNGGDLVGYAQIEWKSPYYDGAPIAVFVPGTIRERDPGDLDDFSVHYGGFFYKASPDKFSRLELLFDTRPSCITDLGLILGDMSGPYFPEELSEEELSELDPRTGFVLTMTATTRFPSPQPLNTPFPVTAYDVVEIEMPATISDTFAPAPLAININGEVVGAVVADLFHDLNEPVGEGDALAFAWWGAGKLTLLAPDSVMSFATDINDHGTAVGLYAGDVLPSCRLFVTSGTDEITTEPALSDTNIMAGFFYNFNMPAINNEDEISFGFGNFEYAATLPGIFYENGSFDSTARIFNNGKPANFNALKVTMISGINDSAQTTGTYISWSEWNFNISGFIWHTNDAQFGKFPHDEDYLPFSYAINNHSLCVGQDRYFDTAFTLMGQAFVREPSNGQRHELPIPAGYEYSIATDVNDDGSIVGYVYNTDPSFEVRIVQWQRRNGVYDNSSFPPIDLTSIVEPMGYTLISFPMTGPDDDNVIITVLNNGFGPRINNNGQIAVNAVKADGTAVAIVLTPSGPGACEEISTGQLDAVGGAVCVGETIDVPLMIQNAPNEVGALGFEVVFDPTILEFQKVVKKPLLKLFEYKDFNLVEDGVLRIGAYTIENTIPISTESKLASIRFLAIAEGTTVVDLQNLDDDLDGWTTSYGCVVSSYVNPNANGDINFDGRVTPADALCAFEKSMEMSETTCGPAQDVACDVTQDCDCTPDDGLCILAYYLELESCLDDYYERNPVELLGVWETDDIPGCIPAIMTIYNDSISLSCGGTEAMSADIVYYHNGGNLMILYHGNNPDPAYQKVAWLSEPGATVDIQGYEMSDSIAEAVSTTVLDGNPPMTLTWIAP